MFQMSAEEHRLPDGKCACFYELGRMSLHSRFKLHGIDRIIKHPQLYFLMKFFLVSGYVYLILVPYYADPHKLDSFAKDIFFLFQNKVMQFFLLNFITLQAVFFILAG